MLAVIHTIFGFVALALGAANFLRRKATPASPAAGDLHREHADRLMMRTVARYRPHALAVASLREPQPAAGNSLPDSPR
jgi:hypothetical protein